MNPISAIQEALVTTLTNEMNSDGTNLTGRLATVQTVEKQWINTNGIFPFIGIMWLTEEHASATVGIRSKDYKVNWQVLLSTKGATQAEASANLMLIYPNLSDILEDPANFSLGTTGTLNRSYMLKTNRYDDLRADKQGTTSGFVAYAVIDYVTEARVVIPGQIH